MDGQGGEVDGYTIMKSKFEVLSPENANYVSGGKAKDVVKVCITAEVVQCVKVEGTYCGPVTTSAVEIQGPVNPWGSK